MEFLRKTKLGNNSPTGKNRQRERQREKESRGYGEGRRRGRERAEGRSGGTITAPHLSCKLIGTSGCGVLDALHSTCCQPHQSLLVPLSLSLHSQDTMATFPFLKPTVVPPTSHFQVLSYPASSLLPWPPLHPAQLTGLWPCLTFPRKPSQTPHSLASHPQLHQPRGPQFMAPELPELLPIAVFVVGNHGAVSLYH